MESSLPPKNLIQKAINIDSLLREEKKIRTMDKPIETNSTNNSQNAFLIPTIMLVIIVIVTVITLSTTMNTAAKVTIVVLNVMLPILLYLQVKNIDIVKLLSKMKTKKNETEQAINDQNEEQT